MQVESVVLKFLDAVDTDLLTTGLRPLEHYLRRFPQHAEVVRGEYERLCTPEAPAAATAPRRLGDRYVVVESLGRGGFGEVHLAEDQRLRRRVAIKVLADLRALSPEWRQRLLREAEATHRIADDGVCPIHDVGFEDDVPFLVMPWIQGRSLDRLLSASAARGEGPVHLRDGAGRRERRDAALLLLEQLARTLHAAHAAGVVHRDVKPANVLVRGDGRPVLIDFGLAWLETPDPAITRSGGLGTPAYAAPEVLQGGAVAAHPRLDVWSLGAVLFECLVLRRPFAAQPGLTLERSVLEGPPPRLDPWLGRDLQAVLEHALERRPERRYQTALALAEDLARVRQGQPVAVRAAGRLWRAFAWSRSRPLVAGIMVGGVAIAISALVVGVSWWTRTRERDVVARTVAALAGNVDEVVRDAQKLAQFGFAVRDRSQQAERLLATVRDLREGVGAAPEIDRSLARVLVAAGGLHLQLGATELGAERVDEALTLLASLPAQEEPTDADRALTAHALVLSGDARNHIGDTDGAMQRFREALAVHAAVWRDAPQDPTRLSEVAYGHLRIGGLLRRLGDAEAGLAEQQRAVALMRDVERLDPDHPARALHTAEAMLECADCLWSAGRPLIERLAWLDELDARLRGQADRQPMNPTVWSLLHGATGRRIGCAEPGVDPLPLYERMVDCASRAAALEPDAMEMRVRLASSLRQQSAALAAAGRGQDALAAAAAALRHAERAHERSPSSWQTTWERISALLALAMVERTCGRGDVAAGHSMEALRLTQDHWLDADTSRTSLGQRIAVWLSPGLGELRDPHRVLRMLDDWRAAGGELDPQLAALERIARDLAAELSTGR